MFLCNIIREHGSSSSVLSQDLSLSLSVFFLRFIYLFFGCAGSSLLCKGFLYLRGVDLLFAACGLFIAVASLVTEPGL